MPDPDSGPSARVTETPVPPELLTRSRVVRILQNVLRIPRKGFARFVELIPTQLNLSWITDTLAAGGSFRTADIGQLRQMGVSAVVDCREEASDDEAALSRHGIELLRLPAPDAHEISQEMLDRGVDWVRERMAKGQKVYVHCHHGVGRGPLLGCCVLVADGMTPVAALNLMRTRRWQASPNEEQLTALHRWAERHKDRGGQAS